MRRPKIVLMGYERNGFSVQLLQHNDGGYEVVYSQRGQPSKSAGLFLKEQLLSALNKYHRHRDMVEMVAAA